MQQKVTKSIDSFCRGYYVIPTFHMLASLPYTTAILLTLFRWMFSLSVSFSSSATKPIKELSGVWAAKDKQSNWQYNTPSPISCLQKNIIKLKGAAVAIQTACRQYRTKGAAWKFCGADIHVQLKGFIFYLYYFINLYGKVWRK